MVIFPWLKKSHKVQHTQVVYVTHCIAIILVWTCEQYYHKILVIYAVEPSMHTHAHIHAKVISEIFKSLNVGPHYVQKSGKNKTNKILDKLSKMKIKNGLILTRSRRHKVLPLSYTHASPSTWSYGRYASSLSLSPFTNPSAHCASRDIRLGSIEILS